MKQYLLYLSQFVVVVVVVVVVCGVVGDSYIYIYILFCPVWTLLILEEEGIFNIVEHSTILLYTPPSIWIVFFSSTRSVVQFFLSRVPLGSFKNV